MGDRIVVDTPVSEHAILRFGPLGNAYSLAETSQREVSKPISTINKKSTAKCSMDMIGVQND